MTAMDALGISDVGDILRGKTTMTDRINTRSNFSKPICEAMDNNNTSSLRQSRGSRGSKNSLREENIRIIHSYINEDISIPSLDEYRLKLVDYGDDWDILRDNPYLSMEDKKKAYRGEEDKIYCGRFPHLSYCGCKYPCSLILDKIHPVEIIDNVFCGSIECAYKIKELLHLKIKFILNVSCLEYFKRIRYFHYYDIYINDNNSENAIKFFKITNRYIADAINSGQKILIHSENGISRCFVFLLAYLIGRCGLKYNDAYELMKAKFPKAKPNDNFLIQLKHYDLEVNV